MIRIYEYFFGSWLRTLFTLFTGGIGLISGIIGISGYFEKDYYDFISEGLYIDSDDKITGYDYSAESAAFFLTRSGIDGSPAKPFLFHIAVEDYRDANLDEEIETFTLSNGLLEISFSQGCSNFHDGGCNSLYLIFKIPGHAEVYNPGVGPEDATRQHPILTSRYTDDGEFTNLNGTLGPNNLIFDFQKNGEKSFQYDVTKDRIDFYAYATPTNIGNSNGEWRYQMRAEISEHSKLQKTRSLAKLAADKIIRERRGF